MPIPDKQVMLDEVNGLSRLAPTDLEAILTAGFVAFLQGTPLDPHASTQTLVTQATQLQCLSSTEVQAIMIRKILEILLLLDGLLGQILFGNGNPEGVVFGARTLYVDMQTPGLYVQISETSSDTGWIALAT